MSDQYYVDLDGKTAGPFTLDQLADLYQGGTINDFTLYATPGSVDWVRIGVLKPLFNRAGNAPPPLPAQQVDSRLRVKKRDWFCTQCHCVGRPDHVTQGSFLVEIFLWLLFCAPGLIYTLWRMTSKKKVCPNCKGATIIPCTSPAASRFVKVV